MTVSEPRVCVGAIAGAQGVRGALRVKSFTTVPVAIGQYGPVEDEAGTRSWRLKVTGEAKGVVICTIAGIADRDAAEALRGTRLYVPRSALPQAEDEDEFYHADLIGLRVEDMTGQPVGAVKAVFDFGAGDMVEVQDQSGKTRFLPFTKAVFPVVDVKGGRLVADPPPEIEAKEEGEEVGGE